LPRTKRGAEHLSNGTRRDRVIDEPGKRQAETGLQPTDLHAIGDAFVGLRAILTRRRTTALAPSSSRLVGGRWSGDYSSRKLCSDAPIHE
jgi:hypothetical protein